MKKALLFILFTATISIAHGQQSTAPPPPLPAKQADPDKSASVSNLITVPIDTNEKFKPINQEASFPGGKSKLNDYIEKNLTYPEKAIRDRIQGKVFVGFMIEKSGILTDIKIEKGLTPEMDAEALKLIRYSPKWWPSIQNGRPVRVHYIIPIVFSLNK